MRAKCGKSGHGLLDSLGKMAVAGALLLGASQPALAGPQGGQVVAGQATISNPDASTTVVNQRSNRTVIDWTSFNVSANESVNFNQPSVSAAALNRIFDQNPSQILGSINANGQVYLINPNGIVFGKSAAVNVGALFASGLNISNGDFMAGKLDFDGGGGVIINHGLLQATQGGSVNLIGGGVYNDGVIVANLGQVNLVAGSAVTVDFDGDGLMQFAVTKAALKNMLNAQTGAAVTNAGTVQADGGTVVMRANVARDVFAQAVNNAGVVQAQGIQNHNGSIYLSAAGGDAVNSGTLDASSHNGNGGTVVVQSDADTFINGNGTVDASSDSNGTGGTIEVLGNRVGLLDSASLDASGALGGGDVFVGGGFHGSDPTIANASRTYVGKDANIAANAVKSGDGGKVVLWSDELTGYYGNIDLQGGHLGGNGGFAEVSSGGSVIFRGTADLVAQNGRNGLLLVDPHNITVSDTSGSDLTPGVNDIFSNNPGGDVTFCATAAGGCTAGSSVQELLIAGTNLDLQANNDITIGTAINSSTGTGNLELEAGRSILINANLTLGGTFTAIANDASAAAANRDAGAAVFTMAGGTVIDTSANGSDISITYGNGPNGNDATGAMSIGQISAGTGAITLDTTANDGGTPSAENISAAAAISGASLSAKGATINLQSITSTGPVTLTADSLTFTSIGAGTGLVTIKPDTTGTAINLGSGASGGLALTDTALNTITTSGGLTIGDATDTSVLTVVAGGLDLTAGGLTGGTLTLIGGDTVANGVTLSGVLTSPVAVALSTSGVGGTIDLGSNILTTGKDITLTGPTTLGANATIDATNSGGVVTGANITLDAVDDTTAGSDSLTLNAGTTGNAILNGAFGATVALGAVNITAGANILLSNITTAGGQITLSGPALIGSTTTLDTTNANGTPGGADITFSGAGSTIDGGSDLTLTAGSGGAIVLQGAVGGTTPLTSVTLSGNTANLQAVTTTGAQTYTGVTTTTLNGTLTVNAAGAGVSAGAVSLAAGGGTISLTGSNAANDVTLGTVDGAQALAITAGGGDIVLGTVGTTPLTSVTLSGNTASLQAVTTSGAQNYSGVTTTTLNGNLTTSDAAITLGAITLGSDVTLNTQATTTAGDITLGAVTGATHNLTLQTGAVAGADVTGSSVAGVNALTLQTIGGAANFNGTVSVTSLSANNTVANVSLKGAGGTITNTVNFSNTGTLTLGQSGGTQTYSGGLTTTGVGGAVTLNGTIQSTTGTLTFGNIAVGSASILQTGASITVGDVDATASTIAINVDDDNNSTEMLTVNGAFTTPGNITLNGGTDGDDTLQGPNLVNAWQINAANTGTLNSAAFNNFVNLAGNSNTDTFTFADAATLAGAVNGGAGSNTLDFSAYSTGLTFAVTGSANAGTVVPITGGFSNIGTLTGGAGNDTFNISQSIVNANGGGGDDSFVFSGSGALTGTLDGGSTTQTSGDTLTLTNGTNAQVTLTSVGGGNSTGTSVAAFSNIENINLGNSTFVSLTVNGGSLTGNLDGGTGSQNTIYFGNSGNTINLTGSNAGNGGGIVSWTNIQRLNGGNGSDTYNFQAAGVIVQNIDGGTGLGTDTINLFNQANTIDLSVQTISAAISGIFVNFEAINGGSGVDTFNINISRTLNLGGGGGNDIFNFSPGVTLTGTLDGGAGSNTLDFSATSTALTFSLTGANQGTVAPITGGFSNIQTLTGSSVNDGFTLATGVTTFGGSIAGGGGTDTLAAADGANTWTISGSNVGDLNTTTTFSAISNLTGGSGDDTFNFQNGGAISGLIDGAADATQDTVNYAAVTSALNITLGTGITNIENIVGNSVGGSVLKGGTTWNISGSDSGTVDGYSFSAFPNITGSTGSDTFTLSGIGNINGLITGGGGSDTLTGNNLSNAWVINAADQGTLTDSNGANSFTGMDSLTGGTTDDSFAFTSAGSLSGDLDGGAGGINTLDYSGYGSAISVNLATFTATAITGNFSNITKVTGDTTNGGTLTGANTPNTWSITGSNSGSVTGLTDGFSNIGTLTGGTGNDTFTVASGVTFTGNIAGGGGTDTLAATDGANAWQITGANAGSLNTSTTFSAISTLTGGSGSDTLTGPNATTAWTITGPNAVTVSGMDASSMDALVGGSGNDTFTLATGITTFSGSIAGGTGTNALATTDGTNAWRITAANAGTLNINTSFSAISTLTGGSGADTLAGPNAATAWTITGANAVTVSGMNASSMEALVGASSNNSTFTLATGITSFNGSIAGGGGGGTNTLAVTDGTNAWVITGSKAGSLNGSTTFSAINTLQGGSGSDTLTGPNVTTSWIISGPNAVSVSGMDASSMEALVGGSGNDTFTLSTGISTFSGSIAGGGGIGTNTLAVTDGTNAWLISGANAGSLNTSTTFSAISTLTGGSGTDTLTGPNATTAWSITGANAVTVSGMAASSMDALVGGTGADTFTLATGVATFGGSIAGGGGTDTLAATDGANTWTISGSNVGDLNTTTTFSAISNL
ncbi:MAG TPA: filamentous hemagglutinin N-terminal domain-containing protein, partial [Gammaproteobacteria bacterium]|nr:filamentous hemagglutinin N-terminal domain-containing protein [Gammaproteobacteria bacterium]